MIINSFGYILSGFQHFFIFLMKNGYCRSSSKKYAKMELFGLKTHLIKIFLGYFYPPTLPMQKNRAKRAFKWVFIGAGFKSPPFLMSIPEAPSCRVKTGGFSSIRESSPRNLTYIFYPVSNRVKSIEFTLFCFLML